jgi:hypothetical protein
MEKVMANEPYASRNSLAQNPGGRGACSFVVHTLERVRTMRALGMSGLLRSVRLRGEEIFCCAPVAAFAIAFDHAGGTIHILNEGKFELQLDGERHTQRYEQGDVILLPAGAAHVVRYGRRVPPVRSLNATRATKSFGTAQAPAGCLELSRSTTRAEAGYFTLWLLLSTYAALGTSPSCGWT